MNMKKGDLVRLVADGSNEPGIIIEERCELFHVVGRNINMWTAAENLKVDTSCDWKYIIKIKVFHEIKKFYFRAWLFEFYVIFLL